MKKKILLLTFAVLFSTVKGFAYSDLFNRGVYALERASFGDAFFHFKKGADDGMYYDCYGPLAVMYAMGLGTQKNPQLAYKYLKLYLKEKVYFFEESFWISFYAGDRLRGISYSAFGEVPKVMAFFYSENYTCKAFGQSPDIKKAVELLHQDEYAVNYLEGDEKRSELFLQYALKENDFKLMKMIDEANPNKFAVLEEKDAENYQNTPKDADSLKKFIDETAITNKWREVAKNEYINIQLNEIFKNGGYNQELADLVAGVAREWNKYNEYSKKKEAMFYSLFDSYVATGEWKKIMSLPTGACGSTEAENLLTLAKMCEPIKAKMKSGSVTKKELSDFLKSLQYRDIDEKCRVYESMVYQDIYASWDKKSYFPEMQGLLKQSETCRRNFSNLIKKECKTWNATTDFRYMEDVVEWFNKCDGQPNVEVFSHYARAVTERIDAWTIETEVSELDAVYDNLSELVFIGCSRNEVLQLKSLLPDYKTAFRVNIEQRLKAVKKIKDVAEAYAKITEIRGMKNIGSWTNLNEEVGKLYVKYQKKAQKL